MSSADWKKVEPFYHCQDFTIKNFFGEEDAEVEWKYPELSVNRFTHTKSYSEFQEEDILYLLGRRGTGKTSIIKMTHHEANSGISRRYTCSHLIDSEDAFHELSMSLRSGPFGEYPEADITHLLIKKWKWIISTGAMISIYKKFKNSRGKNTELIKNYLRSEGLIDKNKSSLDRVCEVIIKNLALIEYKEVKAGLALYNISKDLFSSEYNESISALSRIIKKHNQKCIVLIDSIQIYDPNDKIHRCICTSLIEAIRQIHSDWKDTNIIAKSAFPSELNKRIPILNSEITDRKKLFIIWKYKDIAILLAKRHAYYLTKSEENINLTNLNTLKGAKEHLYKYMPPSTKTQQDIQFDTLAYIIKHTQKKPRQAILLLNIIFSFCKSKGITFNIAIPQNAIRDGVHSKLRLLIDGTFHIFNTFMPGSQDLILKVLQNCKSHFTDKDLDTQINQGSKTRGKMGLSAKEVKDLLIESGAIGVESKISTTHINNLLFVEGAFEYQVKSTITHSKSTTYVLHPMLYQELQARVDKNRFIYPMPNEDEEIQTVTQFC